MKRSVLVISLLAFVGQSFAKESAKMSKTNEDADTADKKEKKVATQEEEKETMNKMVKQLLDRLVSKSVDRLVDHSVDRMVDRWMHKAAEHTDLDKTTLGKAHPDKGPAIQSTQPARRLSIPTAHGIKTGLKVPRSPFAAPHRSFFTPRAQQFKQHIPHATASATQCSNAYDLLFGGPTVMLLNLEGLGHASSEPKEKALGRNYNLVGNWNDWSSFSNFRREESKEHGTHFVAEVPVPASKDIEFQIVGDGDWKKRFFPAGDGKTIFGPTHDGHGENWRHAAPAEEGKKVQVKFFPAHGEKGVPRKVVSELI